MIRLLANRKPGDPIAYWNRRLVAVKEFIVHVHTLAAHLPDARMAVNLCQDRYRFLVSFVAVLLRGQVNLLPPNSTKGAMREVALYSSSSYCLSEAEIDIDLPIINPDFENQTAIEHDNLELPIGQAAAMVFTSGSTGKPKAHEKRLPLVLAANELLAKRLGLLSDPMVSVVATVPPQHMYGLELTVLLALSGKICVHSGKPFFPEDLKQALTELATPTLLVSTPVHLAATEQSALDWPAISTIVSSTGALDKQLAAALEQRFSCPVVEIYGSSETGAIATRNTTTETAWRLLDGMRLANVTGGCQLYGPQFAEPYIVQDKLEILDHVKFNLLGRPSDLVKIAGKRGSLADMNIKLCNVQGVEDGVIVVPADVNPAHRLLAVIVAPKISDQEIRGELLEDLDPVFVPREFIRVKKLPRDDVGKISIAVLEEIILGTVDRKT